MICIIPLVTLMICETYNGKYLKPLTAALIFIAIRNLLKIILLSIVSMNYHLLSWLAFKSYKCFHWKLDEICMVL